MTPLRSTLSFAVLTLTACWQAPAPETPQRPETPPTPTGKLEVSIASVTLADDCAQPPSVPPPAPAAKPLQESEAGRSSSQPAGKVAPGASIALSMGDRACEQSSVQLRVANSTQDRSKLVIQRIELLDERGEKLRDLEMRDPSLWAQDGYVPWDQSIAPASVLQVSYALSAPGASAGGTYTVRVLVSTSDGTKRTLEQKLTLEAEASLPPGAVT